MPDDDAPDATTAVDRALLAGLLPCDLDAYLRDAVARGAAPDDVRRDIHARTGGRLDVSVTRVVTLLAEAQPAPLSPDRVRVDAALGESVGPLLRELIATGTQASEIAQLLRERTDGTIRWGAARVGRLIQEERALGGPYVKPRNTARPVLPPALEPARLTSHPQRKMSRSQRAVSEPARSTQQWLDELERHLDGVLRSSSSAYIIKQLKIGKSKGTVGKTLFATVADSLRRKGARPDLSHGDIRRLARAAGWLTDEDLLWGKAAAREEGRRNIIPRSAPRSFWATIRTERYVRPVNGGLPSLGKRR